MNKIIIEKIHEDAVLPFKPGDDTDGAFDLVATSCTLKYNERGEPRLWYGLGFKTEIPVGYRVMVIPRSSVCKKSLRLANSQGLIDCKYRGEWFVIFEPTFELTKRDIAEIGNGVLNDVTGIYNIGEPLAQCYLEKVEDVVWQEGVVNMEIDRGGGIGSTTDKFKPSRQVEVSEKWQAKLAKDKVQEVIN